MIINLGVNRNSINEVGYNYSVLLNNVNDSRESIKDYIKMYSNDSNRWNYKSKGCPKI